MTTHTQGAYPKLQNNSFKYDTYGDEWWFGGEAVDAKGGQTRLMINDIEWVSGGDNTETAALIVHRVNGWDEQQAKIDELVKALEDARYWVNSQPSVAKEIMDKALTRAKVV